MEMKWLKIYARVVLAIILKEKGMITELALPSGNYITKSLERKDAL